MVESPPSLPHDFMHWLGPWYLGWSSWIDNTYDPDWLAGRVPSVLVKQRQWYREYQEVSHCGTPGCCELRMLHFGPAIGDPVPDIDPDDPEEPS